MNKCIDVAFPKFHETLCYVVPYFEYMKIDAMKMEKICFNAKIMVNGNKEHGE